MEALGPKFSTVNTPNLPFLYTLCLWYSLYVALGHYSSSDFFLELLALFQ